MAENWHNNIDKMPMRQIAQIWQVSRKTVSKAGRELGLRYNAPSGRRVNQIRLRHRVTLPSIDGGEVEVRAIDTELGQVPDAKVAHVLRVSTVVIAGWRRWCGLPPCPHRNPVVGIDWENLPEGQRPGDAPDGHIGAMHGVSHAAVAQARKVLGLRPFEI